MSKKRTLFVCFISLCINAYCHTGQYNKLIYIENKGQWDANVAYKTDIRGGAIFLEKGRITVNVAEHKSHKFEQKYDATKPCNGHAYHIEFVGSNPEVEILGEDKVEEYFNYFLGSNPSNWKGGCNGFNAIRYKNLYPNIDLVVTSKHFQPKYTFYLKHGASVSSIKMRFNGLSSIFLNEKGDLVSKTSLGEVVDERPISFIKEEGSYKDVESSFVLNHTDVGFKVDISEIKEGQLLEIDPQIIFSTYSGSTADNFGATATYDFSGNLYGSGLVFGTGYPTTTGAYQTTFGGSSDVAITKFNPSGSTRVYSTYIGGSSYDVPHSLVVDQNNRLILLATTSSSNYPTTSGAYKTSFAGGPGLSLMSGIGVDYVNGADIVITKFNPAGTGLVGSTYFGGSGSDGVGNPSSSLKKNYGDEIRGEVETDTFGNIYIASLSTSTNLPTHTGTYKSTNTGGYDGILLKFNTNLTSLLGATYVGGSGDDALYDLSFDNAGNIVAAGGTASSNIGVTAGVLNSTYLGNVDGMVVSLTNNLSSLRFCSYFGTNDYDQTYFVETDKNNQIYLFGQTTHSSSNYYLLNATYSNPHKGQFVSILNPNFSNLVRSTMIGAGNQNPDISPTAFLVDYCDKIFITGWGSNIGGAYALSTTGLPVTSNAFQSTTLGNGFYMSILEGDLSALYYGTFFGGTTSLSREHVDGGTSRFDKNGIVYHAVCAGCGAQNNFPIYPNASSVVGPTNNSSNCNLGVIKFDFGLPVTADFTYTPACAPASIKFNNYSHIVSAGVQYYWTFSNGSTSNIKEPSITFANPGVYTAKLVVIDSASCNISDTLIKNVVVLGTTADTLSDKIICPGNSIRIGFTNVKDTGMTFSWTPTASLDDPTILSPFASPTTTTTYRLVINKTGCTDTFYQEVIVESPKTLTLAGDTLTCSGVSAKYIATKYATGTYDWFPKNILTSFNRDTANVQLGSLPVDIIVNYTSLNGCLSTAKIKVSGGVSPQLNVDVDTIVCKGDIVKLVSKSNMSNGVLSFNPTMNVISANGDTSSLQIDTTIKLVVTYTISSSCIGRDTVNIRLLKDQVNWKIDSILCYNELAIATANTNPAYNLTWQPSTLLSTPQGQSPAKFNLSNTKRKIYIQAIHNQKSYCKFEDSVNTKFIQVFVKLSADTIQCKDSIVTIYHGNSSGATKSWQPSTLLVSQDAVQAKFRLPNSGFYKMTISDSNCVVSDSIYIHTANDWLKITGDSLICPSDTANLRVNLLGGATYHWTPFPPILTRSDTTFIRAKSTIPQWFYIHIQDTNNCYIFDSFFVNHLDTSFVLDADFTAATNCQNLNVIFSNTTNTVSASPTYFWNFAGQGSSTAINPSFSFSNYGLQTVTLIATDNTSCNKVDTVIKPIYILNNSKAILPKLKLCKGDSVSIGLDAMNDPTASITWSPNTNMSGANTFNPKVKVTDSTVFTAYISKNGCTDTLIQTVVVDTPRAIKIQGNTSSCEFEELLYTATKYVEGTYNWQPFSNISYQNRDSILLLATNFNTQIKLNYISEYGCVSRDSMNLSIVQANLSIQMDTLGCKDEVLTMQISAQPTGGTFIFMPPSNIISSTNTSALYKVDTTRTVWVEYRLNNKCRDTRSLNFKLLKDAIDWKPDSITCRNQSISVIANTNNRWNIIWSPSAILQSLQGSSPAQFGPISNEEDIYISAKLKSRPSCEYMDTARVKIFENTVKITGPVANCKDSFVELTATNFPNTTYAWTPTNALFNANQNKAIFKTDVNRWYYVRATFKNQCTAIDFHKIVVGNPNLKLWGDTVVCQGDTVTINATPIQGATYLWSNGVTTSSNLVTINQTTTYYLDFTDTSGCRIKDSIKVHLFDKAIFTFIDKDTIICTFDTVKLRVPEIKGVNYQWTPSQFILNGQGTNKIEAWIDEDTKFYILGTLLRGGKNCQSMDSILLHKDTQYIKLSGNHIVCYNDTLMLNATDNSTFTYTWLPNTYVLQNRNNAAYIVNDSMIVTCIAVSSLTKKCKYTDSVRVDYSRYLDDLVVTANPDKVEYGKTTTLSAVASNIVGYEWSPAKTLSNRYVPEPIAKPDTTMTYYVTVRDPLGCRSEDSVTVTIFYEICDDPEVYLPTGFTPNSDGKNDALYVMGDNITKVQLMIYDRWGQLVFESNNQKKGWDGKYNGIELEPGVFAYYLYVECLGGGKYSKKGNITLIK